MLTVLVFSPMTTLVGAQNAVTELTHSPVFYAFVLFETILATHL
jgi:hypothetical protein